jgi:tRNA A37 threonylcarbamoyladenosine biosynthesis protein TsaE
MSYEDEPIHLCLTLTLHVRHDKTAFMSKTNLGVYDVSSIGAREMTNGKIVAFIEWMDRFNQICKLP